jgi:hypothetical protein
MERVTDEEAGEGGWFWNEQVGSFRPPGALYCRECGVLIQGMCRLWCATPLVIFADANLSLTPRWTRLCFSFLRVRYATHSYLQKTMTICVPGLALESAATTCGHSNLLSLALMYSATSALLLLFGHCWMDLRHDRQANMTASRLYSPACLSAILNRAIVLPVKLAFIQFTY